MDFKSILDKLRDHGAPSLNTVEQKLDEKMNDLEKMMAEMDKEIERKNQNLTPILHKDYVDWTNPMVSQIPAEDLKRLAEDMSKSIDANVLTGLLNHSQNDEIQRKVKRTEARMKSFVINRNVLLDHPEIKKLLPLLGDNGFIAGGCFKDILRGQNPKDVDVFFRTVEDFNKANERFNRSRVHEQVYDTGKSVGYKHKTDPSGIIIDLIKYQFGTPAEVIDRFDITVCKFALFKYRGGQVVQDVAGIPRGVDGNVYRHSILPIDSLMAENEIVETPEMELVASLQSPNFFADLMANVLRFKDHFDEDGYKADGVMERIIRYSRYGFNIDVRSLMQFYSIVVKTYSSRDGGIGSLSDIISQYDSDEDGIAFPARKYP